VAEEEQSATPWGVKNVCEDSDDEDAYSGEQKEIQAEVDALHHAQSRINPPGWDSHLEAFAIGANGEEVDLRKPMDASGKLYSWTEVKKILAQADEGSESMSSPGSEPVDYPLNNLDPTQRVFADRVLKWGTELVACYRESSHDGEPRDMPILRTWLCGSAGSGKSTTLKTIVQHLRLLFLESDVPAKVELTAYTGVAAFNIGFGARTTCSGFQIFPNATWSCELKGKKAQALEDRWRRVELLVVDEISFIGRAMLCKMHLRLQQGRRAHFAETATLPENKLFGNISIILVGDFGQLDPIDDFTLCELKPLFNKCPVKLKHLWKHAVQGHNLASTFKEAILLKRVHRSKDDSWWTESCLLLRNISNEVQAEFADNYHYWREHDLDRGHFNEEQKEYFDTKAVWLCARCEDVGTRNGRKLASLAQESAQPVQRIQAMHSVKSAQKRSSDAFSGLRSVIHLVRNCMVMITRNVAYLYGLANGTRGFLVGIVYPEGAPLGSFPLVIIVDVPDYCGPIFYPGQPTWVPIFPKTEWNGNQTRTQFPIVAGFAMTVNKSQGLTIKEGVVINLQGSARFKPASKHGLPFVAWTRSESFAMTAFKNIPPLEDFQKVIDSDMWKNRREFDEKLENMHRDTLRQHSNLQSAADEDLAHQSWVPPRQHKARIVAMPCPACSKI
jgi:hypothetical protein